MPFLRLLLIGQQEFYLPMWQVDAFMGTQTDLRVSSFIDSFNFYLLGVYYVPSTEQCTVSQQDVKKIQTLPAQISEQCETDTNHLLQPHQRRVKYKLRKYPGGKKEIPSFEKTTEWTQPGGLKTPS